MAPDAWVAREARVLVARGVLPALGARVFLAPGAAVIGDVAIGDESSIWYNTVVRGDIDRIRIGSRSNLQDLVVVHVTGGVHPVTIGDRVTVGHGAIIHGCVLEDGCLVGMGAKVLDGARIGSGSLVAAGSVVAPGTQVPPGVLVVGAPARVRRPLDAAEVARLAEASALYVGYAREHAVQIGLAAPV